MATLVANELLCYVQNNLSKHPRLLIGVAINGFYTDDEVSCAKLCLHGMVTDMKIDGLPRLIRRQGDNRRKLECEDIISLFTFIDGAKRSLPTFVAVDLQRVPSVSPGDVDVYALAASVSSLSSQLDILTRKMDALSSASDVDIKFEQVIKRLDVCETVMAKVSDHQVNLQPGDGSFPSLAASKMLYSNVAARPPKSVIRVKGSATLTCVKAVPRGQPAKLLKAFVGRMDSETTEEALRAFLSDAGLAVIHCRRLKPPEGKSFKTAAFYVACSEDCAHLFYEDETWPDGAELRDWYTSS